MSWDGEGLLKGQATCKVEGGKLVNVEVFYNDTIEKVKVTGDFFIHPEEGLEDVEQALAGVDICSSADGMTNLIERVVTAKQIMMIGVNPKVIAVVVMEALH